MISTGTLTSLLEHAYTTALPNTGPKCPIRGSAAGFCPRRLSMELANPTEEHQFSARTNRTFEAGNDADASLKAALTRACTHLGLTGTPTPNYPVWTTIPITGSPAAIVARLSQAYRWKHGEDFSVIFNTENTVQVRSRIDWALIDKGLRDIDIVEIKTKRSWGMKSLEKEGAGDEYEAQMIMQIEGARQMGYHVNSAHWLFENKDSNDWTPLKFELDTPHYWATFAKIKLHLGSLLSQLAGSGAFPGTAGTPVNFPPQGGKLPWQCNYCPIGPEKGQCANGQFTVLDERKTGAEVPAWVAH